ncbi:MAG TPA: hypothetical protein VFF30_17980 [Nitrososphaerales archaeon]|nr:hypothetical protein [Nitrososphaerales archaeon]
MPKSSISVDSSVATDLSDEATRQGKTLYGFANECIRSVLSVCEEGGSVQEIYSSWKIAKMSKEFGSTPIFSRELLDAIVRLAYSKEKEKLLELCLQYGKNYGIFLSMNYPKREDLVRLVSVLQPATPSRVSELKVVQNSEDDTAEFVFRYVSALSLELTECMEKYLRGMFSAYSLKTVDSKVGVGIIELRMIPE